MIDTGPGKTPKRPPHNSSGSLIVGEIDLQEEVCIPFRFWRNTALAQGLKGPGPARASLDTTTHP